MEDRLEFGEKPNTNEVVFNSYGTYLVTDKTAYALLDKKDTGLENPRNVVLISQPDWNSTLEALENREFGRTTVLTPELITISGLPFNQINERSTEIERSLEKTLEISKAQPHATFVIGTPYFVEGHKKPFNAALAFKNGEMINVTSKRLLAGDELDYFDLNPEDLPTKIADSTLLVCRDLIGAQKTRLLNGRNGVDDYVLRATKDKKLSERFVDAQFIAPDTNRILVSSCWGTGMPDWIRERIGPNTTQESIDNYYYMNLKATSEALLRRDSTLKQIIICDRDPQIKSDSTVVSNNASRPMSTVFFSQ